MASAHRNALSSASASSSSPQLDHSIELFTCALNLESRSRTQIQPPKSFKPLSRIFTYRSFNLRLSVVVSLPFAELSFDNHSQLLGLLQTHRSSFHEDVCPSGLWQQQRQTTSLYTTRIFFTIWLSTRLIRLRRNRIQHHHSYQLGAWSEASAHKVQGMQTPSEPHLIPTNLMSFIPLGLRTSNQTCKRQHPRFYRSSPTETTQRPKLLELLLKRNRPNLFSSPRMASRIPTRKCLLYICQGRLD